MASPTSACESVSKHQARSDCLITKLAGSKQTFENHQRDQAAMEYNIYLQTAAQARGLVRKLRMDMHKLILRPDFDCEDVFQDIHAFAGDLKLRRANRDASRPTPKLEPATLLPKPTLTLVNDLDMVADMVDHIYTLSSSQGSAPLLYIDCEGVNLGRNGTLTLMPCYMPSADVVYMIDIQELAESAFSTPGKATAFTMKDILESSTIKKAIFDCRCDSDALFRHYSVRLGGITDIQLLDLGTCRNTSKVSSLRSCMGRRLNLPEDVMEECQLIQRWGGYAIKQGLEIADQLLEDDKRVLAASNKWPSDRHVPDIVTDKVAKGEVVAAVNVRPIPEMMEKYVVSDVILLPALYKHYVAHELLTEEMKCQVEQETEKRLALSWSPDFVRDSMAMNAAPESWR